MSRRNRVRVERDLQRDSRNRPPRKCVLIVCEGAKTEPMYWRSLRHALGLRTVEVEIVGEGAEIIGLVDKAIELRNERIEKSKSSNMFAEYDEIWCVVDTEREVDNPSWNNGENRAKENGIRLAWSNPCFEFWLLLHFERIGRSFDGYHAVRKVLKRYIKDYQKNVNYFAKLAPSMHQAIERSKAIHQAQWRNTRRIIDKNPATTVHELVESMLSISDTTIDRFRERYCNERAV